MFQFSCPQCGANVAFHSSASLTAICQYCHSTLFRNGDTLERIGTMTEALEDYSPVRIGVTGSYRSRAFTVLGRIQLRYPRGSWNEWYLVCDDGSSLWLSDASGQYVVTALDEPATTDQTLPPFSGLRPGSPVHLGDTCYWACDIRTACCHAGEGELPFRIGAGWNVHAADCRAGDAFITLDYPEVDGGKNADKNAGANADENRNTASRVPRVYRGEAVALDALNCQGLRTGEEIRETAGRYRGDVVPFACPNCGAPLSFVAGVADFVTCGACHSGIDCSGKEARVFAKQREIAQVETALSPGDVATFDGVKYTLLGLTRCQDSQRGWVWDEYLLHHPVRGFLWLVNDDEGWDRVQVLNRWPQPLDGQWPDVQRIRLDGKDYRKGETYRSEIVYALGAFNWQAEVGDVVTVTDYALGKQTCLTAEVSAEEWVWSQSMPVPAGKIAERFGKPLAKMMASGSDSDGRGGTRKKTWFLVPVFFSIMLLIICSRFDGSGAWMTGALLLIWWPAGHSFVKRTRGMMVYAIYCLVVSGLFGFMMHSQSGGTGWGSSSARGGYSSFGTHK